MRRQRGASLSPGPESERALSSRPPKAQSPELDRPPLSGATPRAIAIPTSNSPQTQRQSRRSRQSRQSRQSGHNPLSSLFGMAELRNRPASWPSLRPNQLVEDSRLSRSTITSARECCENDDLEQVFRFDVREFGDGTAQFVPASATDKIHYVGRFLHHGPTPARRTKINTVQFDWPAATFEIAVRHTTAVVIRLKGDGNYFNVFVNGEFRCILRALLQPACFEVASDLDPNEEYRITVSKRTEPQMRGALSTFKVCTFYGFIVDGDAEVLDAPADATRKIEFIGDSDTCAFGNEGQTSSARKLFGMKGRKENVYNGYACILARMFNADAHILAWSGKGVHSNAGDWGPNMLNLWKHTIASRPGRWDMTRWVPDAVVINLGINDLFPPASTEAEIVSAYSRLIRQVRTNRPNADIFCVVCDEGCISSEDSEGDRKPLLSLRLQEIIKVAIAKESKHDAKVHFVLLKVDGGLQSADYATLMHYAVDGHVKIAKALANEISLRTHWKIEHDPQTMPYPQDKKEIVLPMTRSSIPKCVIS